MTSIGFFSTDFTQSPVLDEVKSRITGKEEFVPGQMRLDFGGTFLQRGAMPAMELNKHGYDNHLSWRFEVAADGHIRTLDMNGEWQDPPCIYTQRWMSQDAPEQYRKARVRTWFVPYAHIFRLTRRATNELLCSPPWNPLRFSTPPPRCDVESTDGSGHGHRFGALCQIMPREAFELVGGCDERFRGWGAEDAAFLRALDTLWGRHRNTPNDILHLWHDRIIAGTPYVQGQQTWEVRLWAGQKTDRANDWLGQKYQNATGNVDKMRKLVDEQPKKWWQR